ncbi:MULTISPECIES: tetratricopeptide repeat protein [unclassified Schlesneria]|uniref:tetratricopeptide repeat protein n=1 Tax=Schlesneria TaxID=656899 RepID=UPI0035A1C784
MSGADYSPEEQRRRKLAADCFNRATQAMAKQNWDYAVEMFATAVKMVPDNLMYRQSLRGCERKKYKDNKTGASMAFLKLSSVRGRIRKARSAQNWVDLDQAAEEGLAINPWDAQFNADLGDAARERGFLEIAAFAFEQATSPDSAPENKDFLIALAEIYEQRKNFTAAINTLDKVMKLDPLNGAVRSKIQALGANMTIHQAGYDEAESTKEVQNTAPKQGYEQSVKGDVKTNKQVLGPGESVEADLQRMMRKEPQNVAHYQKLADYYRREGRLEESVKTYKQALDVSGDVNIREQMEDVELDMVRQNLNFAKEAAARDQNETSRAIVSELANELLLQEIEVYSRRADRYPNDLKLKHELAKRFMRCKKYDKAIPLLQAASKDIRLEAQVLTSLGSCFLAKKQNNLAKRQFEKALEKLSSTENPGPFKECSYYLGRLAEEASDNSAAEKYYSDILAIDYGYKDVAQRLTEIQGGDDESAHIDMDHGDEV